jgi:hypothetical protein
MAYFDFAGLTKSSREVLSKIMDKMHESKELVRKVTGKLDQPNKRFVHEKQVDEFGVEPHTAKKVIKMLRDEGYDVKMTGIIDDAGDVLHTAQKEGHKKFIDTYKKQSWKENVKDHKQYNDFVVYENDAGFMNWNKATKGKLDKPFISTIDEVVEMVEPIVKDVKKAEGGRIGLGAGGPPISGEELKQIKKESNGSGIMDFLKITGSGGMGSNKDIYYQGQQIPGLDQKQYNYGFGVDANIPFNLPGGGKLEIGGGTGFGRGRTETTYKGEPVPGMSGMGESRLGDQWNIDAKITYPFADGGLTKTIPPERGPDPQGLPSALYNGIMRPRSY